MDITKQYIKYIERARGIIEKREPKEGDLIAFTRMCKNFDGCPIELVIGQDPPRVDGTDNRLSMRTYGTVQLLRQDQIQDMLRSEYPDCIESMQDAAMIHDLYKWMKKNWEIVQARFWTPEQKWFGFLIFKKYNKVWSIFNEGEWVSE